MRARGRSFTACATTRVNRARLSAQMIDCYAITGEMSMEGKSRQPETAAVRGGCVCSGVGTGQVVAQVVNGLPTIKRPSGTKSGTRVGVEASRVRDGAGRCAGRKRASQSRGNRPRLSVQMTDCYAITGEMIMRDVR